MIFRRILLLVVSLGLTGCAASVDQDTDSEADSALRSAKTTSFSVSMGRAKGLTATLGYGVRDGHRQPIITVRRGTQSSELSCEVPTLSGGYGSSAGTHFKCSQSFERAGDSTTNDPPACSLTITAEVVTEDGKAKFECTRHRSSTIDSLLNEQTQLLSLVANGAQTTQSRDYDGVLRESFEVDLRSKFGKDIKNDPYVLGEYLFKASMGLLGKNVSDPSRGGSAMIYLLRTSPVQDSQELYVNAWVTNSTDSYAVDETVSYADGPGVASSEEIGRRIEQKFSRYHLQ